MPSMAASSAAARARANDRVARARGAARNVARAAARFAACRGVRAGVRRVPVHRVLRVLRGDAQRDGLIQSSGLATCASALGNWV